MSWFSFSIIDLIDITLFALLLYYTFKILNTSGNRTIFAGIIAFMITWAMIKNLKMPLMGWLFDKITNVGLFLIIVLFQDEIKRFLSAIGSTKRWRVLSRLFNKGTDDIRHDSSLVAAVTLACINMSKKKIGALIVIENKIDLETYEHTGEIINADVNARLLENIFFKNSPLHDGALIISDHRIAAAGCILPLAHNANLSKDMGLRHRSGLGMAQLTDAKVIIVSEERGKISIAFNGVIIPDVTPDKLQRFLSPNVRSANDLLAL